MNKRRLTILISTAVFMIGLSWFINWQRTPNLLRAIKNSRAVAAAAPQTAEAITTFQAKLKENPADAVSYTILSQLYLRQARESGDVAMIQRAETAVQQALALVPDYPFAQLTLAAAHYAQHNFQETLDIAQPIYASDPDNIQALILIGDAQLALGHYHEATVAYVALSEKPSAPVMARLAHQAELNGRPEAALQLMEQAAWLAWDNGRSGEDMAWYLFRLGELHFNTGDLKTAESYYSASLHLLDNYYLALAALGKVTAAQGHYDEAIAYYERAIAIIPQPDFLAALGDLYTLMGQPEKAQEQYDTVVFIGQLAAINQQVYNRQLALFYADHDLYLAEALALATAELDTRQDIHGYDAAAWAYYKNGRLDEAQAMIDKAMQLGTREARLYYHAGLIAYARSELVMAKQLLHEALTINPHFDLLQAPIARATLADLTGNE